MSRSNHLLLKEKLGERQLEVERFQARMVSVNGRVRVKDKTGYVWIRIADMVTQAFNLNVQVKENQPVWVIYDEITHEYVVEKLDATRLKSLPDWDGDPGLANHARAHEPGGGDPINVYTRMLVALKTYVTADNVGLTVNIAPYGSFGGQNNKNLASSQPVSGLARYVLVYLDTTDNTIKTVDGATTVDLATVEPAKPALPDGGVASAYVRLDGDQTTFAETDIKDARDFLNANLAYILKTIIQAKGDLIVGTGAGAVDNLAVGANDTVPIADSTQPMGMRWGAPTPAAHTHPASGVTVDTTNFDGNLSAADDDVQKALETLDEISGGQTIFPIKNVLYNSLSHDIWPEGANFANVADGTKFAAQWYILHNGSGGFEPNLTRQTAGSEDTAGAWPLLTGQEAAKLAGFATFLKAADTYPLRGRSLSISFEAQGLSTIRAAVLSWSGTADSYTVDVVGSWATGNPTLVANWSYANTPAASIDTTPGFPTRFKVEGITFPTTGTNLALFVWTPDTFNFGDTLQIRNVQLEIGTVATEFVAGHFLRDAILSEKAAEYLKIWQLWESDGGAVAAQIDATGNLSMNGGEIYAEGENTVGTFSRARNRYAGLSLISHFQGGGVGGATFAGSPFDNAPTTSYLNGSYFSIITTSLTGSFYYKAPVAGWLTTGMSLLARSFLSSGATHVGIRFDDGTNNNYVMWLIDSVTATGSITLNAEESIGGSVTNSTYDVRLPAMEGVPLMLRITSLGGSSWRADYWVAGEIPSGVGFVWKNGATMTWTVSRVGLFVRKTGGTSRAGIFDYVAANIIT